MTIASRPLIITLRHILVADAMPSLSLATFDAKPRALSSGISAAASGPPSSSGTLMRYGGTEVITRAFDITRAGGVDETGRHDFRARRR